MKDLYLVTKEDLLHEVETWAIKTFGPVFKFRPKQKETIVDIIYSWAKGTYDYILDAPTGSGKSVIAMCVAGVLSDVYDKTGYILISDLSLLKQYEDDINVYLPTWGVIRGRQTYTCQQNMLPFTVGVCALQGCTSYVDICTNFPECSPYCEYIQAREKAKNSKVTVCTYAHWLIQQNYVRPKHQEYAPFQKRDFVICDEAHKLVDIVQSHFSPKFGKEDLSKIYLVTQNIKLDNVRKELDYACKSLRDKIKNENDVNALYKYIVEYKDCLKTINNTAERIKVDFNPTSHSDITFSINDASSSKSSSPKYMKLSQDEKKLLRACDFVHDHFCKFDDYVTIIDEVGPAYIIKNDSENGNSITFNCINESYLLNKTFHYNANMKLYMSATIGDPNIYANEISIKSKYKASKLPIVFDYSKSPIFYIDEYKMSYAEKDRSFGPITRMIESILRMYPNQRGIIQTGSYSFANKLYESIDSSLKSRLLVYNDTLAKQESIDAYKYSQNKVLIGPSLVEGLSLDDDLCRFLILTP